MKKESKQKFFVTLIALFFIGSMAAPLLYSAVTENGTPNLPQEHILQELPDDARKFALSQGYVIIDAEIPDACYLECAAAKRSLEDIVPAFSPAVYLVERGSRSSGMDIPIAMESYKDKKSPAAFNRTEAEDFICESNRAFQLDECVMRKIDIGGGNATNTSGQ